MSELLDYYVCRTKQLENAIKWYSVWSRLDKLFREVYANNMVNLKTDELDRRLTYGKRLERKTRLSYERLQDIVRLNIK
jgi:hypothetical protein